MALCKIYTTIGLLISTITIPVLRIARTKSSRQRVRGVIVSPDKKVLLIKDWFGNQEWSFPGGGIKRGESPEEALCREIYEELGIKIHPKECKFLDKITADGLEIKRYLISRPDITLPRISRKEILETRWVNRDGSIMKELALRACEC